MSCLFPTFFSFGSNQKAKTPEEEFNDSWQANQGFFSQLLNSGSYTIEKKSSNVPFCPSYQLSEKEIPYDSIPDSLRFQYEFKSPLTKEWISNVLKRKWFVGSGNVQILEIIENTPNGISTYISDSLLSVKAIILGDTKSLNEFDMIHVTDWNVERDFMWEGAIWEGDVIVCRDWSRMGKGGVLFGEPMSRRSSSDVGNDDSESDSD